MARKSKRPKRTISSLAQLKVRLPEHLRIQLERAAKRSQHSMNAEIVKRLIESYHNFDKTKLIAQALVRDLDDSIVTEMVNIVRRIDAEEAEAESWREEEQIQREAEKAADEYAELMVDMQREGGPEDEQPE